MAYLIRISGFCLLAVPILFMQAGAGGKGKSMVHELDVNGNVRNYRVYQPEAQKSGNMPLMIVLHGGLGNAEQMEKRSGMNQIAESGGFIVAYPDGTGGRFRFNKDRRTWNAGRCCGQAVKQSVNDVLFIGKLIDDMLARYSIDGRRVYVTGMSNGAMMTYRLACEIPDKIAAIIPVSGTLAVDNCDSAKNIPVLHIHGDQDTHVPYSGGEGEDGVSGVAHRSVPDTIDLLVQARQALPPVKSTLNSIINVTSYSSTNGAPVSLYVIKGGGHVWPGGSGRNDANGHDISASRIAWEFARQYSRKDR